jgi:hypothetical protein
LAYSLCDIPNKYNIFTTLKRIRMKKQLLLLTAGGMLALASCKNEAPATAAGPSDAQIDSMVNARVEEMRTQLMAENDSLINALAQWKADSMIAAMKGTSAPAKPKPVAKKPAAPNKAISGNSAASATGASSSASSGPATGKNNGDQGQATGKNTGEQGQATGKR